jgi:hypothetical protein
MKKHLKPIVSLLFLTALLISPYFVFAAGSSNNASSSLDMLNTVAQGGGYQQSSLPVIVGTVIRAAFSLLGGIFIILIILGGYEWMLAEGNEQKIEKAKNYIKRAIVGLIVTLSAWAMWTFILEKFILG